MKIRNIIVAFAASILLIAAYQSVTIFRGSLTVTGELTSNDSLRIPYVEAGYGLKTTSTGAVDSAANLGGGAGTGTVQVDGTPTDGQIAVWTDASTIEGGPEYTLTSPGVLYTDGTNFLTEAGFDYTAASNRFGVQKIRTSSSASPSNSYGLSIGADDFNIYTDSDDGTTYFDVNEVHNATMKEDTLSLHKYVEIEDTTYMRYFDNIKSRYVTMLVDSVDLSIMYDSMAVVTAGWARLPENRPEFKEFYKDTANNEWAWYYKNSQGEIIKEYGVHYSSEMPSISIQKMISMTEFLIGWHYEHEMAIESLKNQITALQLQQRETPRPIHLLVLYVLIGILFALVITMFRIWNKFKIERKK